MPIPIEQVVFQAFRDRFSGRPRLFGAPGRINIIGEHTDYSEGFVMPAAIDRTCIVAMAPNDRDELRVLTLNRQEEAVVTGAFKRTGTWIDYVAGVKAALGDAGIDVPGCDLVIRGNVPEGAGVSSSAALEVSAMNAMLACAGVMASTVNVALWAQSAEVKYVGMPCGVMDQFISANGVAEHALVLDCRSLSFKRVRMPDGVAFVVIDSQVRHRLVDGGYAARRADCETAAKLLGVRVLRDARLDMLAQGDLPDRIMRRARHVISENLRVEQAAKALADDRIADVGALMNASHASLRDDFNVTCAETDTLAAIAASTSGVLGARQMGGGFGGAVLALVNTKDVADASAEIIAAYRTRTGIETTAFMCSIGHGAREITL